VPPVVDATSTGPEDALPDALEQRELPLLHDPVGPFEARYPVEFSKHLGSARVVAVE
jgi:hypothetical protein